MWWGMDIYWNCTFMPDNRSMFTNSQLMFAGCSMHIEVYLIALFCFWSSRKCKQRFFSFAVLGLSCGYGKYPVPMPLFSTHYFQFSSTSCGWVLKDPGCEYGTFSSTYPYFSLKEWIHVSTYVGAPLLAALVVLTQLHMMEVMSQLMFEMIVIK